MCEVSWEKWCDFITFLMILGDFYNDYETMEGSIREANYSRMKHSQTHRYIFSLTTHATLSKFMLLRTLFDVRILTSLCS